MKKASTRLLTLAVGLGLSLGVAVAQTTGGAGAATVGPGSSMSGGQGVVAQPKTGTRNAETKKEEKVARADRKFMQEAAEGGMFEVEAAQLAESKATNPDVRSFATTLARDHSKANDELVKLANAKKVELPPAPPRGKRKDIEKLGKLSGVEFDQRFMREVGIKDHEKDIKMFEKASEKAKDADLKAWIDKTLPKLREHLAMAQKLPANAAAMGNRGAASAFTTGPARSGTGKSGN